MFLGHFFLVEIFLLDLLELFQKVFVLGVIFVGFEAAWGGGYMKEVGITSKTWGGLPERASSWL